jgi:hypothetical protein
MDVVREVTELIKAKEKALQKAMGPMWLDGRWKGGRERGKKGRRSFQGP